MLAGNIVSEEYLIQTASITTSTPSITIDVSQLGYYKHLKLVTSVRTDRADVDDWVSLRFNSATSGYAWRTVGGNGSTAVTGSTLPASYLRAARASGATAASNLFGCSEVDILDFANSFKNKTIQSLTGVIVSGFTTVSADSGIWFSTAPITSITLYPSYGSNFAAGSRVSIYGVNA
jgi:hypothetical protein